MSTLSELYITMENLRKLNLPIDERLKQEAAKLEEDLIRTEILPTLTEKIEPALAQVQRELVLVVDYVPGTPLKVSLSRKRNISDVLPDAVEISPKIPHIVTATGINRSARTPFRVEFADGYICTGNGKDTFIDALKHMKLPRVATFENRIFAGFPLVGRKQRVTEDNYKWQENVDGWWIYVNMSNDTKIEMIRQVADYLGISVKVMNQGQSTSTSPVETMKGKRAMFSLNGGVPMNKRATVLTVVKNYVSEHPQATFSKIKEVFPDLLQGSYGVVRPLVEIQNRIDAGQDAEHRYYLEPENILKSADEIVFAVSHQWGNQFPAFQKHVKNTLNWDIEEI